MPEEADDDQQRELTPEDIDALLGQAENDASAPAASEEETAPEDSAAARPVAPLLVADEEPGRADLPDLAVGKAGAALVTPENLLEFLGDVPLQISIELGRANLTIGEIVSLREGAVVELDKLAGESVDVLANGMLIARGEVVVVNEYFSVRVTEIVTEEEAAG